MEYRGTTEYQGKHSRLNLGLDLIIFAMTPSSMDVFDCVTIYSIFIIVPFKTMWQGPHQSAQKSTRTGSGLSSTSFWKFASVRIM